ncbi:hypothetical protein ACH5RR_003570 [Cinchona calisaya]|uniref:Uncharacterized protein n=1 Tax=Cinchona calisaya TaxID=153742 RepID=A0ABD3AV64_9GENT
MLLTYYEAWKHSFYRKCATLDGPESNDNTISGLNQFELVARNVGKPSNVTPFSNMEKRLPVMPTMHVLAQPVLCAPTMPFIFSVTSIASEQHLKTDLGIGEKIQQQILGTSFERLLEYSDRFAKLFRVVELDAFDPSPLHTRVENLMTHISKYHELHNNFSEKLIETALSTRLAAIQR